MYHCYGMIAELQLQLKKQINLKTGENIEESQLFTYCQNQIQTNCQFQSLLQQDLEDIYKFKSNINFKLNVIQGALSTFIHVIQNYTFDGSQLIYNRTILHFANKITQNLIITYGYNYIAKFQEIVFWILIAFVRYIN